MGNCGKFGVPGSGVENNYMGIVEDSFELRIEDSLKFMLSCLQVIKYLFPLF